LGLLNDNAIENFLLVTTAVAMMVIIRSIKNCAQFHRGEEMEEKVGQLEQHSVRENKTKKRLLFNVNKSHKNKTKNINYNIYLI
jgi:hypothetical protein